MYFKHAFRKSYVGTKPTQAAVALTSAAVNNGLLTTTGVHSVELANTAAPYALGVGTYGFFNPDTMLSVNVGSAEVTSGKPLVLAGAALMGSDKIGPFHGGYQESNKSKMINPRYVNGFFKIGSAVPEQSVIHIGNTNLTTTCEFDFLCGENYALRIDLAGSPVLRLLNHDAYRELSFYGGCCPTGAIAPVAIDSTLAMIDWANQIIADQYLTSFVRPIVYTEFDSSPLFATPEEAVAAGYLVTDVWSTYVSPGHTAGNLAGIRLAGAYVDTKFGNCTFQVSDFFEKEIVIINASLVNYSGDVCTFTDLCVVTEFEGFQGQGFGESMVRDLILDESYLQNHFASDLRIREITQGDDILNALNRNAMYTRYIILHSVPRFYNNTSAYDNQQYALNIYVPAATATSLEAFMAAWLTAANSPVVLESYGHTPFTYAAI